MQSQCPGPGRQSSWHRRQTQSDPDFVPKELRSSATLPSRPRGRRRVTHRPASGQDFDEQFTHLASTNQEQYFEVFFRHLVESTLFARPAVYAAAQLGIDAFEMVSSSVEKVVVEFIASLRHVAPDLPEADLQTLARAIRRFCLASIIDASSSNEELRSEFYLLEIAF